MCGRYAVTLPPEVMATLFGSADRPNLAPRWNVAPTQQVPVVAIGKAGTRRIIMARWGLRPAFMAKDPPAGPLFNARGETVREKPAFRAAFARKRCLVPADGFYEWQRAGKERIPHFIRRRDAAPVAFAGLWEAAPGEAGGPPLVSASIITTAASAAYAHLHDRFPVFVPPDAWVDWLDPSTPAATLMSLLHAPPDREIEAFEVSARVNKVVNDDSGLVEPVSSGRNPQ